MESVKIGRDLSFDILKGILIILVVLGHALSDTFTNEVWQRVTFDAIYSFHMPLFIMVSGYFSYSMSHRSLGDVLRSKCKRILLPWFLWSTVLVIIYYTSIEFRSSPLVGIGSNAKEIYRLYTEIWYLVCVFILSLFWFPFTKLTQDKSNSKYMVICLFLIVCWLFALIFNDYIPNVLLKRCQLVRQTLSFGIGLMYCYKLQYVSQKKQILYILIALMVIILDKISFGFNILEYKLYQRIIDGMACGVIAFAILKPLSNYIQNTKLATLLLYCGKNSLGIYVIHMAVRFIITKNNLLNIDSSAVATTICFIVLLSCSIITIEFIKRLSKSKSYILGV